MTDKPNTAQIDYWNETAGQTMRISVGSLPPL
jgi:hypothetical protein